MEYFQGSSYPLIRENVLLDPHVGVETKLIVYKGFGHGINKPKERLAAVWHNGQWFARYLWDEEVEMPLEEEEADEEAK